jgi:2-phospho-L-lactate transferase/gluconeogenesis factor (CofD/UPF0052 family)
MTQPYETIGFSASDHLFAIIDHLGFVPVDYMIINTKIPNKNILKRYRDSGADIVIPDLEKIKNFNVKILTGELICENDLVRHDPDKLANFILKNFISEF